MASASPQRGSRSVGCAFLIVVFGPMIGLVALWVAIALTGGQGESGMSGPRDELMRMMVWVLMIGGAAAVAAFVAGGLKLLARRRSRHIWRG